MTVYIVQLNGRPFRVGFTSETEAERTREYLERKPETATDMRRHYTTLAIRIVDTLEQAQASE